MASVTSQASGVRHLGPSGLVAPCNSPSDYGLQALAFVMSQPFLQYLVFLLSVPPLTPVTLAPGHSLESFNCLLAVPLSPPHVASSDPALLSVKIKRNQRKGHLGETCSWA